MALLLTGWGYRWRGSQINHWMQATKEMIFCLSVVYLVGFKMLSNWHGESKIDLTKQKPGSKEPGGYT